MDNKIVAILLAVFLPPIAVWLKTKNVKSLIINIVLCFLMVVPAVIHALLVVL